MCSNVGSWIKAGVEGEGGWLSPDELGRSDPNLKPGTVCVCGMSGLRNGENTTQHPPSPASRAGTDPSTNVQAVSRAVC